MTLLAFYWTTLAWWQWALLFAVPPAIVALYFLKLRREPLEVPSTYLWQRTIEDLHVNSLWQRLRQSLLLFLQLLLVLLLILACFRLGWQSTQLTRNRAIFLIDTSASMAATDVDGTRLEDAKRQVSALIDEMDTGDVAMIISFSDRARVEQPFTSNRRVLRRKLDAIRLTQHTSDLSEALRVAAGLANPGRASFEDDDEDAPEALPADLFVFTDGGFPRVNNFALGNLNAKYVAIGKPEVDNIAILAFSARRNPEKPDQLQAFAQLQNFGQAARVVDVSLHLDGNLLDAKQVDLPADGEGGVDFTLEEIDSGTLRLQLERKDQLTLDNTAYAAVNAPRRARILLVTPRNDYLETALQAEAIAKMADVAVAKPDVLTTEEHRKQAAEAVYDLIVYDQCAPEQMPQSNTMFIGGPPPGGGWLAGAPQNQPQVIDSDRAHPLMQFVELGNVNIYRGNPLTPPPGSTPLIETNVGTLAAIGPRGGLEDLVLGFLIVGADDEGQRYANTDWPIRLSFPLFANNVVRYFGGHGNRQAVPSVLPGHGIALRSVLPVDHVGVQPPDGRETRLLRSPQNTFVFNSTDRVGVYQVREGNAKQPSQLFAVNLFDETESDIRRRETIGTEWTDLPAQPALETARFEAWKYLLAFALVVLVFEWYVFNRRVYL